MSARPSFSTIVYRLRKAIYNENWDVRDARDPDKLIDAHINAMSNTALLQALCDHDEDDKE